MSTRSSVTAALLCLAPACVIGAEVIFEDDFNTAQSYEADLTYNATHQEYGAGAQEYGHLLTRWIYGWEYEPYGDWMQAFWNVPDGSGYMQQSGRSGHPGDYWVMAPVPVPDNASHYTVEFRQYCADNDVMWYTLAADRAAEHGFEFKYQRQVPGTDETVNDAYLEGSFTGPPGTVEKVAGMAFMRQWADHRIEVNGTHIRWTINGLPMAERTLNSPLPGGYVAMRHFYDRNSRIDDFRITVLATSGTPVALRVSRTGHVPATLGAGQLSLSGRLLGEALPRRLAPGVYVSDVSREVRLHP